MAARDVFPLPLDRYRGRAEATVAATRRSWRFLEGEEVGDLVRAAMEALATEAGRDLRQVLFQIRLAVDAGAAATEEGRAELAAAIDRATAIVQTHLDRDAVQRMLIAISPERFDLAAALVGHLGDRHLLRGHGLVLRHAPVWVEGDKMKLIDVLGHLVGDAVLHVRTGQHVVVDVGPAAPDGAARVYIGTVPPSVAPEELVRALDAPLRLDAAAIDVPYARAVVERHGGSMRIEESDDGGVGYGFRLRAVPLPEVRA